MSFIWNIVLSFDDEEWWEDGGEEPRESCEPLEHINTWLSPGRLVDLTAPTYADDAGSGMDANLYGGGFKRFDIVGFIGVVKSQKWKARSKVQLWVKGAVEGMGKEPFDLVKLGGRDSEAGVKTAAIRNRRANRTKVPRAKRPASTARKSTAGRKA